MFYGREKIWGGSKKKGGGGGGKHERGEVKIGKRGFWASLLRRRGVM